ncbi:hypothetical protein SAMN05428988_3226 [Chitinophaga sp. YR573]|uniref:hypothetical protein n=1 Tax=Chitinophaga sp. YR573 TaxID=1881040 RepID=UPI0008D71501|nr:hypothetical protein [Chitinophaga sp. YR573]SEW21578.1 hypothetical protein SAMN05428988_3226 [Chitinophaga sp. YR573]
MRSDNPYTANTAQLGMNTDAAISAMKEGQLTFARNAVLQNFDGKMLCYQNEQSNELCGQLKPGFKVIGLKNIIEQQRSVFFMVNPDSGDCEICQQTHGQCTYATIINARCLNFNISFPIHKVIVKTSNCSTQLFWTDGLNPPRWIDLEELPWLELPDPADSTKKIKQEGTADCNKLLVQPNFSIPVITPTASTVGGSLRMGSYQFAVQYAGSLGSGLTGFYGITNAIGIWESRYTQDTDLLSDKAIALSITGLDRSGLYDYFNLVLIKTINNIANVELVGTYPVGSGSVQLIYSGESKSDVRLTMEDIFERFPYYDTAQDVTTSDNALIWADMAVHQKINYQQIWSKVKLFWETWKIPVTKFEGYNNPINTSQYRGYMGDEVYAFEGCFILRNGKITEKFHIPGRLPTDYDLQIITGDDVIVYDENPCADPKPTLRWQVYNTATFIAHSEDFIDRGADNCYIGPYQYGLFGYHESTELYPDNRYIWGDLAGKPIRHHRFPDAVVCPIHDDNTTGNVGFQHSIYPKGVRVDLRSLYDAIDNSDLSDADKSQIAGFKITRANRASHKSVVAKGLLFNVGTYNYQGTTSFYPNYPLNDLRPDPFLAAEKITAKSGDNPTARLDGFSSQESKQRYTFHSPDTHFYQPYGVDSGYLKLESVEYGKSRSHFVEVKDNAKYKFLTKDATKLAFAAGMASVITLDIGGGFGTQAFQAQAGLQLQAVIPSFTSTLEVIKNITPAVNYGWQLNVVGNYSRSVPVENSGSKIRRIDIGGYLTAGMQHLGDIHTINNLRRESSVYLKVAGPLPFPHEVSEDIAADNSRYLISESGCSKSPSEIEERNICAYYGAIKRIVPGQYGRMYSYESVDTGYYQPLSDENGVRLYKFATVFGGDCFINRFALKRKLAFFLDETVNKGEGTDINLDDLSNIGYPMFWYSTKPIDVDADLSGLESEMNTLTDFGFWTVLGNLVSGGTKPLRAGLTILNKLFQAYLEVLGVANINLDCAATKNMNEIGKAYLFAYGIPYFFTESEVNTDYRQAINIKEGDYFPNVGADIPDDWLQETFVPIANDNLYVYNKSYSKQNKETYFHPLQENFDPTKTCQTHFANRIIYSEKANMEELKNNWLVYRPVSYFDLPKNYGPLTAVDGIEDRRLLVRLRHKSLIYNVMATLDTQAGIAQLGNPAFFSGPPVDFIESDYGYAGSAHKLLIKCPYGNIWVDTIRGQVLLHKGTSIEDLALKGMNSWLMNNLPFQITSLFKEIGTDNHFNHIGLTGIFDTRYNRLLLTKKDFLPLNAGIEYSNGKFFLDNKQVQLSDAQYFCNKSWTLSYSFITGAWVAYHSYIPDYYIGHPAFFQTGFSGGQYDHGTAYTYGSFYGLPAEYILEYPLQFGGQETIIGSVHDYTTVLKYTSAESYHEVENDIYFNHAVIYSDSQCSGILNLKPKPRGNLKAYLSYPKFNTDSKDILVTKSDHLFNFNQFWDIVSSRNLPFFSRSCQLPSVDRIFIKENLDYGMRPHTKSRIRSKDARIRLIYDSQGPYKLITNFLLTNTQDSFK